MAKVEHKQNDFSGGEVGLRVLMRDDTEMYQKSCTEMLNFVPSLQGSAIRRPGTEYVYTIRPDTFVASYNFLNVAGSIAPPIPADGAGQKTGTALWYFSNDPLSGTIDVTAISVGDTFSTGTSTWFVVLVTQDASGVFITTDINGPAAPSDGVVEFTFNRQSTDTETVARIIPFITSNNERGLVEITPQVGATLGDIRLQLGITGLTNEDVSGGINDPATPTIVWQTINDNWQCNGQDPWEWTSDRNGSQDSKAFTAEDDYFKLRSQSFKSGDDTAHVEVQITAKFVVPETTTAGLQIKPNIYYSRDKNNNDPFDYLSYIRVGTSPYGLEIADKDISGVFGPGQTYTQTQNIAENFTAGDELYISLYLKTQSGPDDAAIFWDVNSLKVNSQVTLPAITTTLKNVVPYTAEQLPDVQYVQSPYVESVAPALSSSGKQLVLVHPNHPPKQLYFGDGGSYVFDDIFQNDDQNEPEVWDVDNYPAACTSYLGRLCLGGSIDTITVGSANGSSSETVWTTEVGKWYQFTDPNAVDGSGDPIPPTPSDSVEFTAIYRSPIQWLIGQKELLIGAEEMEYTASGDGIFSPGDLGVFMQSTHGSSRVQPVGMGQYILFPADAGKKVRSLRYIAEDEGWVSPDMTLAHPELLSSGIVRMVRMRNPNQMLVVVMENGQLALLHQDPHAGVMGWSRVSVSGTIKDACVLVDDNGLDVLYVTVARAIGGKRYLMVEAISNWSQVTTEGKFYTDSTTNGENDTPSNILSGLGHLEGLSLQVVADGTYYGDWDVVNGTITLIDDMGMPINVNSYSVGISSPCGLTTMPLISQDPGSTKRYTSITVRTLDSIRPLINGERVADRDPASQQNKSQPRDLGYYDSKVAVLGADEVQFINVSETIPFRVEVIGIFGTVKESSL